MAISTILLGRYYRRRPGPLRRGRGHADLRKKIPERHKRPKIRHRIGAVPHRLAGHGVEHPLRKLQQAITMNVCHLASSHRAASLLDHLMYSNNPSRPRMPSIHNHALNPEVGAVGVLSSCSTPMITHTLALDDINEGFDLMHAGKSIRAVVVY
jgi:hypothetical protein